jgi:acyl-CoA thioester hydrolase
MSTEPVTFSIALFARWPDMDFNQHMRNAAFLGGSEDCRMSFLAERGFTIDQLRERKLGPVVLEDRLLYKKELRLLERFRVDIALAAITRDGRRMRVRNTFRRESDGVLCATVDSVIIWFDLVNRKPIVPPDDLRSAWFSLVRTDDFAWYEDGARDPRPGG